MGCTVDPQNPLTEEENQNQIFKENVLWSCKHVTERKETFREESLSKCRQLIINKDSDFADVSKVDDTHKSYMGCVGEAITSSITTVYSENPWLILYFIFCTSNMRVGCKIQNNPEKVLDNCMKDQTNLHLFRQDPFQKRANTSENIEHFLLAHDS